MAEMFLPAAISTLMEKATDHLLQEFSIDIGVEPDRQNLCRILLALQAIVVDAEERSRTEPTVRAWMCSLKNAVHEAEDVYDELKYDAIRKAVETENRPSKKAALSLSPPEPTLNRDAIQSLSDGRKLKGVLKRIEFIVAEMNQFGFSMTQQLESAGRDRSRSHLAYVLATIIVRADEYALQTLDEDDLWIIFRRRAFALGVDARPELVEIGKQLIKKCCRSPLVVKALGGLLSYKNEKRGWLDVLESNIWDEANTVDNQIAALVKLSYFDLPSYMKRCFAFCAIFPKDFEIDRDTLIQLWMANSFIPSQEDMEIEAKGIEIFNELAWRGFFQHVQKEHRRMVFGGFSLHIVCRIHHLIHELAQSIIGNELASFSNLDQQNNLFTETLHVSTCCKPGIVTLLERFSFIHTLLDFGYTVHSNDSIIDDFWEPSYPDLSTADSLRALGLHCKSVGHIDVFPGVLKHLRYLDLSGCSFFMTLPESFSTLYNLQTLPESFSTLTE